MIEEVRTHFRLRPPQPLSEEATVVLEALAEGQSVAQVAKAAKLRPAVIEQWLGDLEFRDVLRARKIDYWNNQAPSHAQAGVLSGDETIADEQRILAKHEKEAAEIERKLKTATGRERDDLLDEQAHNRVKVGFLTRHLAGYEARVASARRQLEELSSPRIFDGRLTLIEWKQHVREHQATIRQAGLTPPVVRLEVPA